MRFYQIFFVVLVSLFFAIGGLFVDTKKRNSELENRELTKWTKINDAKMVEKYLSDRVLFRDFLLKVYFTFDLNLPSVEESILRGKDGWAFQGKNSMYHNLPSIPSYQNKKLLSLNDFKIIRSNLKKIKEWCDDNNIKFYIMFPPDKHRVYHEYMPDYIQRENNLSIVKQLKAHIEDVVSVIPLEDKLIVAKKTSKDLLYFKEESHWAEDGAFIAYQELMNAIKKDFSGINILTRDNFLIEKNKIYNPYQVGENGGYFSNGNQYQPKWGMKQNLYNHFEYKNKKDIDIVWKKNFDNSTYAAGYPLNVYIVGDSFACYIYPFLSATFQRVRAYRFNMPGDPWGILFNKRKQEFEKEKPDILIFSISDLKLQELLQVD